MQQLEITRQRPIIEIRTTPAKVNIERVGRPEFRIHRSLPVMQIQRRLPTMQIDRSQGQAMLDRMSLARRTQEVTARSYSMGLEAIGRIAEDGNRLAAIYSRHNTISRIIAERAKSQVKLTTASMVPPQITWDLGEMEIEWSQHEFSLEWIMDKMLELQYEPGSVDIEMVQYPSLDIQFIPMERPRFEAQIPRRAPAVDRTL